jgi:S-adenosyl-L-methionine hydrolase (adenosine-forming)
MAFAPTGLITLATDFGSVEPYVGIVKARILQRLPVARIVDLAHELPAGRADIAGFWLARAWREFPPGTVHLAVVDPGVGTARGVMLAEAAGQVLLAPDNGLLPEALRGVGDVRWRAMDPELPARLGLAPLSRTFHGRDLFGPLAGMLAAADLPPEAVGAETEPDDPRPLPLPALEAGGVSGEVLVTDRFGNLISNIGEALLAGMHQPVVSVAGLELELRGAYGEVPQAAPVVVVNAFGLLEIALNGGRAADALGLAAGAPVRVRDGFSA